MAPNQPLAERVRELASWRAAVVIVGLISITVLALAIGNGVLDTISGFEMGDGADLIEDTDGVLQYVIVFLLAPWLGIVPVVVIAIGLGVNAVGVGVSTFLGAVIPIYGLVLFYGRLWAWWGARNENDDPSKRHERMRRIWNRYGLPGYALVAPAVMGVVIAAATALALGSKKRAVLLWMTVSVAVWVLLATMGAYYGISYFSALF